MMAQLGPKHVAELILHKGYRCVRRKRLYFLLVLGLLIHVVFTVKWN